MHLPPSVRAVRLVLCLLAATLGGSGLLAADEELKTDGRDSSRRDFMDARQPLQWYQPKPLEFPPHHSGKTIDGEVVAADFIHRAGQFRVSETGALINFTMAPYAAIHYLGAEADLRDVPLGTQFDFVFVGGGQLGEMRERASKPADALATEQQAKKFAEFTKRRGIPGWIDKTEGNLVTVTFFSGAARDFKKTWMNDFAVGKGCKLCVANDELRTWNPPVDGEGFSITEVRDLPTDSYGCSGVQVVGKVTNMLEGFRRGRVVRVFGAGWKTQDQFYGESLMGYGFGRMQNQELVENVAKEYPEQFPFRTDYGNAHLPWYQLKDDVKPPAFSEHLVFGELIQAESGSGQIRAERTGEVVNFTLIQRHTIKHLGKDTQFGKLPLGLRYRFHCYQDDKGAFTRVTFISDEFSHLIANAKTARISAIHGDRLDVAWQLPEVKDYNGDMQRPPDIGRSELRVSNATRVWKGEQQVKLADLAMDDVLLLNVTSEQSGAPSVCTDIWVGAETHSLVSGQKPKTANK
ncbi:MAG: hypothetical protein QOE70_2925 [Chthoniobacter sp.]|nr:hypothetical protein [Chthoniobacter sp.]